MNYALVGLVNPDNCFMQKFTGHRFKENTLEFRFENGEVCIYGAEDGLRKSSFFCNQLADNLKSGKSEHIHLQDLKVLAQVHWPVSLVLSSMSKNLRDSINSRI